MSSFLQNTQEIFDAARLSDEPEDFTIHLNGTSFRVVRAGGTVAVEGQSGFERCLLQTKNKARTLVPDQPRYLIAA